MKCILCDKEADTGDFCKLHVKACENLMSKYNQWKEGLGVSWKEYLSEIAKNPLTGKWAREVAQYMMEMENQKNVKNS